MIMEKKGTTKDEKTAMLAAKIEETDETKLKLMAQLQLQQPTESEDILYPAELNAHLIDQLKVMTCENNELRKCVFTKNREIKELNKTVQDTNQRIRDVITGTGPAISSKSAGIISSKITDLCKQNRHLVSEVEGYKTKNAALERKIMTLELLVKDHEKIEPCLCKDEPIEANPDEVKELNMKLAIVNKKLYESKNKNLELKNDILSATKVLQQELGDKFTSIKELQGSCCKQDSAGWKGRAQQIVLLQKKISELEEKLGKQKECSKAENFHSQAIKDIEARKKREVEQMTKEYDTLKHDNQELKKKLDGARCRIRNLECDATLIRQKMQTLLEKSSHDDLLINEQRNEIKNLEIYYQEILKENTGKMSKQHSELVEYQKQHQNTDAKIDALRKQANEKSSKIEELRAQLLRYEECSLQSVFFTPMKTATDNELQQLSTLIKNQNVRLDSERHKVEELEAANRKLREKKKKVERRLTLVEEELKTIKEDMKRGSRASKVTLPKDQAFEYIVGSVTGVPRKRSSLATMTEKPSESSSSEGQESSTIESLDRSELKFKLELTEEKLKILEDKLKMIEEEKQEDINHLTDMIQTSKQLFNEALCVLQKERCVCIS